MRGFGVLGFSNEADLQPRMADHGDIELGTVGWADSEEIEDLGDGPSETGRTLVRITLFVGRDRNEETDPDPGVASGKRILAQISAPTYHVPKRGSLVVCLRPARTSAWYVAANPAPNTTQFKGGARSVQDYGSETDLIIKARSITLMNADGMYLTLHPDAGFKVADVDGSGMSLKDATWMTFVVADGDAKTFVKLNAAAFVASNKSSLGSLATLSGKNGVITAEGKTFAAKTGNVALGANASPAMAVQVGPSPYMAPSTTIYGQT